MKKGWFLFGVSLIIMCVTSIVLGGISIIKDQYPPTPMVKDIQKDTLEYCYYECTIENVYSEIMKADIKFSEIVLRQAMHECKEDGKYFNSWNCLKRNNLFGYKGGVKTPDNPHGYSIYTHWVESVKDYKGYQERNMPENCTDYYEFLRYSGYAEDGDQYVKSLKSYNLIIVKSGTTY